MKRGSTPDGYTSVVLSPDYSQHFYQVKQSYPWPNVPAHETYAAVSNCWNGNQLPGDVNFIPGVSISSKLWNVPTSYANSPVNRQYNVGYNIQGYSPVQNANVRNAALQIWQNRAGF